MINKTIKRTHKGKTYKVTVNNPYNPDRFRIEVNGILYGYVRGEKLVEQFDYHVGRAIDRYEAEKTIGIKPIFSQGKPRTFTS